ncbi:MAG: hydrogenase formation protein HypD [Bdellovibrionales bacterium GWA2_49_15]|nr:MAG: hydrogenase formation protein HypD [Bdellovibrionales bacterium GWA2_49_15]HAZ14211.1 hydrogenase formation protein HypD [Bdellovibrionales bacterium]
MNDHSQYHAREPVMQKLSALRTLLEDRPYRFMEFCGGHTHAFFRYGLASLLPRNVELIHGPGCPVCVLPAERITAIVHLLEQEANLILYSYGDLMRVPGENRDSLVKARARGLDIRMIYDPLEILKFAQAGPDKTHVFFAIGFETTTPPTALLLQKARALNLSNLLVYCNHVLPPPAAWALLSDAGQPLGLDGIIGPGHVCTITGPHSFQKVADDFKIPVAIAGFFPLDLLRGLENLICQSNRKTWLVANTYPRSVRPNGNLLAQAAVAEVFSMREHFSWRGLGEIPQSALTLSEAFAPFDLERRFALTLKKVADHPQCLCPQILRGQKKPSDCGLFGKVCNPDNPIGACMVSGEGSCAAYYGYGQKASKEVI